MKTQDKVGIVIAATALFGFFYKVHSNAKKKAQDAIDAAKKKDEDSAGNTQAQTDSSGDSGGGGGSGGGGVTPSSFVNPANQIVTPILNPDGSVTNIISAGLPVISGVQMEAATQHLGRTVVKPTTPGKTQTITKKHNVPPVKKSVGIKKPIGGKASADGWMGGGHGSMEWKG